ncbi:hypothetical protein ACQ4WP_24255 [Janthinobacterium sp. GB4P2]|uniref:hypothetical protein n=1 Tax=Janthinobacterium sp. GB4P2 TaxID=3424189 RepID=UPI003F20376E
MVTREQIEKIYKEIQPHFVRTKDVEGYAGLFTVDAVWWPLNRPTRIGPEQIAEGFRQVITGNRILIFFRAQGDRRAKSCSQLMEMSCIQLTDELNEVMDDPEEVILANLS